MGSFEFGNTMALLGLVLLPFAALLARRVSRRRRATVRFSDVSRLRDVRPSLALRLRGALLYLRLAALALLIVAMARPRYGIAERNLNVEGIDIFLCLDVSGSMQAKDFRPNRLEAAKRVLREFVSGRESDRIGVIVFASTSFTLVPLTLDYGVIDEFVDRVDFGVVDPNNTAVGSALGSAVKKMEDSTAKSKVAILLTDGRNNAGKIPPLLAAEAADALGVRVYCIGVGSKGRAFAPGFGGPFANLMVQEVDIDEDTLREIAKRTGGKYYRATDEASLSEIFKEIDRMEKTRTEVKEYVNYSERMSWLVWPALALLLGEMLLGYTRFVRLP